MKPRDCSIFFAGLSVGAAISMLLAPKPGKSLRSDMKRSIREGIDTVQDELANTGETLRRQVDNVKEATRKGLATYQELQNRPTTTVS